MIFVTVGTDGPFDRLVTAVDVWAGAAGRGDVYAQIGKSKLKPRFLQYQKFLEPAEFRWRIDHASVVVSHAGMGTILTALRHKKPLLVMPRLASLGEQRNEHQLATARRLSEMGTVAVAFDESQLLAQLNNLEQLSPRESAGPYAQPELTQRIQTFIHSDEGKRSRWVRRFRRG